MQGIQDTDLSLIHIWYYLSKLLSFYGRINCSLKDIYLLTATMRADGSTKFGKNNKRGYFPSGAVSWKMHNEPWLNNRAG